MKKWVMLVCAMAAGLGAAVLPVQADDSGGRILDRIERQEEAIWRGRESGELTRWEARQLQEELSDVRRLAEDLRHDGYPARDARRTLNRRLDKIDRQLHEFLTNDEYRYPQERRPPPPRPPAPYEPPPQDYRPVPQGPPRQDYRRAPEGPPRQDYRADPEGPPRQDYRPTPEGPPRQDYRSIPEGPPRQGTGPVPEGPPPPPGWPQTNY